MKEMKTFNNTEFGKIGVLVINGKEYFPATECAKILGYVDPYDAVNRHTKGSVKHRVPTSGGEQEIKFIPEGDLYRLIVKSKLPEAERFERWIFDEVLPDIRKHGVYMADKLLDDILKNPDLGIKIFTEYKEAKAKAKELELENAKNRQMIGELKPKASYYDLILQNKSVVPITVIAKDYGMSGRALNKLLHELGVQYKMHGTWLLYQHYADMGYTQSKTHAIDANRNKMHTYWTQKGRLFLYDLLKNERNLLPLVERERSA
ncbi:phage antirepressor KilAC domain-containing protein [Proteinivorax hydrogeniformans]|uniref:Phage antirepressor KilAC domain-containing protein n=1 Tax=Proteinivorax hydrogeniformans TaxID=1826727 RepID=A0AAU8HS05_9FIRM